MKKLVIVASAMIALAAGSAGAADLPVKTRPMLQQVAPVSYWTGFYLGGQVGASAVSTTLTFLDCCGSGGPIHPSVTQVLAGGYLGYNFQAGPIVFGIEADLNAKFGSADSGQFNNFNAIPYGWRTRSDREGSVRGRVGYLITERGLLYGTGGWAFSHFDLDNPGCPGCSQWNLVNLHGGNRNGWVAGLGLEYALDPSWHLKLEYLHADYGTRRTSVGQETVAYSSKVETDSVRVGLSYRWGAWGKGPVVAQY